MSTRPTRPSRPSIFLSVGVLPEDKGTFPSLDLTATFNALQSIAVLARHKDLCLVARDQTEVADQLETALGCPSPHLLLVPEQTKVRNILFDYLPRATFYLGGGFGVEADYEFLARAPDVISAPLPATGGAAALVDLWQSTEGRVHPVAAQDAGPCNEQRIVHVMNYISLLYGGRRQTPSP